jgi:mannose/cellobiose epimerase-like protein (N-acyl-D-glucosamine 2-epimerase family)
MMVGVSGLRWPGDPAHGRWLEAEADRLLAFGRAARDRRGGFAWLDRDGRPDPAQPRPLWITCRMTHAYVLGTLLGRPGSGRLADHGIAALRSVFADVRHGGWFAGLDPDGRADPTKSAYEHVFVVLAAASATVADRDGALELLRDALAVLDRWFWQEDSGLLVDTWDEPFQTLDGYRGVNANMHAVEAMLAAYDAIGDRVWLDRALRITTRVLDGFARGNGWRVPEHFDEHWRPLTEYNADEPAHPFRPYGATIGHSFEWSRLALHVRAALGTDAPPWLLPGARALFDTAVRDGWSVDGAEGFVYTVDWSGRPVVRQRMHWVAAEAVAAAAALLAATGDAAYADWYRRWWDHIDAVFVDLAGGSWWHELDPDNRPASTVWSGKPDVYHALQATLLPRLPLAPGLARALRENRLDA